MLILFLEPIGGKQKIFRGNLYIVEKKLDAQKIKVATSTYAKKAGAKIVSVLILYSYYFDFLIS